MISSIGQYNYASSATATQARPSPTEMFNQMDSNGDGSVDKAEFTAFGQLMASKIGKPDKSEEIFAKIDADGNGKISRAENEAWLSQMEANRSQGPPPRGGMDPEKMFAQMDSDSDGYVTEPEFKAFQDQMTAQTSESDESDKTDKLFSQIDTDGDGKISQSENDAFVAKMESKMQSMLLNTLSNSKDESTTDNSSILSVLTQRYSLTQTTDASSLVDMLG